MEEQLITFETAKLAKEKGFDEPSVLVLYNPPKVDKHGHEIKGTYTKRTYKDYYKNPSKDGIERIHVVTQSLLQRWLREVHNIHIEIDLGHDENNIWYNFYIMTIEKSLKFNLLAESENGINSYEEALETGLHEALKLI